jgi:D-glycero-alpha-D-manno-heptose-7-phosphate kinase
MKIRSKAPLRLSFGGGGTELSPYAEMFGGEVLNATISMFAHVYLEEIQGQIIFEATDMGLKDVFKIGEIEEGCKTLKLHYGVYKVMINRFNQGVDIPMFVKTYCDAPIGSGLGSSSTLTVALIEAFNRLLSLALDEYQIASLAYEIERIELNLSGGKQDQFASAFGGINYIEFSNNQVVVNSLRLRDWISAELESRILLFYTGKSRESANIIESQVNSMSENSNLIFDKMHAIKENARAMKVSLLKGDIDTFGQILHESWLLKRSTDQKVSNPSIDAMYETALSKGAIGGKISGAGGGGFFMFICKADKTYEVAKSIQTNEGVFYPIVLTKVGASSWLLP